MVDGDLSPRNEENRNGVSDTEDLAWPLADADVSMTELDNFPSLRQRTYDAYKKLPKTPRRRATVACHLLKRMLRSPATSELMLKKVSSILGPKAPHQCTHSTRRTNIYTEVPEVRNLVQANVREISRLRNRKKFDKITVIMNRLRNTHSLRDIAKVAGMSYSTLYWMTHKPNSKAKRYVTEAQKKAVVDVFLRSDITFELPCKKYAEKHYMRTRFEDAYKTYCEEQRALGNRVLKKSSVYKYLPPSIRWMHQIPFRQCLCDWCLNNECLIDALLAANVKGISRRPTENLAKGFCPLQSNVVSDDSNTNHHSEEEQRVHILDFPHMCIFRNCTECGVTKQLDYIIEENTRDPVNKFDFQKEVVWHEWKTVKQRGYSSFAKVTETGTVIDLLQLFAKKSEKFGAHLFNMKWQGKQFEKAKEMVKEGEVVMCMDFAQNFDHRVQNEPQSAHWSRNSSTVHPIVCYYRCPEKHCTDLVTEELMMFSTQRKHDAHLVYAFENVAFNHLHKERITITKAIQFTDNCAAQYKGRRAFEIMSLRGFPLQRNYFGAKHGKGPADGAIGRLSRELAAHTRADQVDVLNTDDLYNYANSRFSSGVPPPNTCLHKRRRFFLVNDVDRTNNYWGPLLKGTQLLHCIRNTGTPGLLEYRSSSCFCR